MYGYQLSAQCLDDCYKSVGNRECHSKWRRRSAMVLAIGLWKSGEYDEAEADIVAVVEAAGTKALVKVIIETS